MLLIPAIDLQNGKCVRLRQGDMRAATVFSDDPLAMAARWVEAGARRLHIVDLDGAAAGEPKNAEVIHQIAAQYPDVPIQVGGGIRSEQAVAVYIQAGVRYVIIGTRAVAEPHFISELCVEFPTHVIVGLDAKDGLVATDGWAKLTRHSVIDLARKFESISVQAIIHTDIARDGMLGGANIAASQALAAAVNIPVIVSGGIHNLAEVKQLAERSASGIIGAITGRAIYEGTLDFAEGQKVADATEGQKVADATGVDASADA